jgi:hypothetical protein
MIKISSPEGLLLLELSQWNQKLGSSDVEPNTPANFSTAPFRFVDNLYVQTTSFPPKARVKQSSVKKPFCSKSPRSKASLMADRNSKEEFGFCLVVTQQHLDIEAGAVPENVSKSRLCPYTTFKVAVAATHNDTAVAATVPHGMNPIYLVFRRSRG